MNANNEQAMFPDYFILTKEFVGKIKSFESGSFDYISKSHN